ncbi:MAG: restriction endonuclease [Steroidobacteraceae bacterium]
MNQASKLPWRIGVGLAVLSFLLFHLVVDTFEEPSAASNLADTRSDFMRSSIYTLALLFQFILPTGLLIGAGASFVKRSKGFRLFEAAQDDTPSVVRAIGWREFEALICEAFRREGYRIDERRGSGPDGGIDLIATMAKKRILIQCKHWKTQQVGVVAIRELNGIVTVRRADGGVIVAGGTFTKEARDFAETCRIRLIDGNELQQIIGSAQSSPSASPSPIDPMAAGVNTPAAPHCPKCGAVMIDRIAKQGTLAGKHFWGCSRHPKCMGIRPTS